MAIPSAVPSNSNIPILLQGDFSHIFTLQYCSLADLMSTVDYLMKLARLDRFRSKEEIKRYVEQKEATSKFDTTWLEHFDERTLKETYCTSLFSLMLFSVGFCFLGEFEDISQCSRE